MGIDVVALSRFLLTGVALLLVFLAAVTWNRRQDAPEATVFAVLFAFMAVYSFGYAGEVAQTTLAGALRWLDLEYLAVPWAGGLWVLGACRHNGIKGRTPLLFIVPVITFVSHFLNPWHLFYTTPMTLEHRGPFWVLNFDRGPLSVLDNAYLMVCFLAGAWIYMRGLRHSSTLFRKQAIVLLLSSFLPFVGYFGYLSGLSPWGLDFAPVTLAVTCVLLYYGIFHCGMFDLAPLARHLIFNSMRDAVLILDAQDRLLDFNPAAKILLPVLNKRNLGTPVIPMLGANPALAGAVARAGEREEVFLGSSGFGSSGPGSSGFGESGLGASSLGESADRCYEVETWPLFSAANPASRRVGRAVILADVSAQVRLREELRSRAETDPLTGAANRRRFHQALEIECLRFARNRLPLSVLMVDLDSFKDVNDRYGHPVGDVVLRTVAQLLLLSLRKTDLLARYGGEEFAILLPETPLAGALVIAERVRQAINQKPILAEGNRLEVSISVGAASHSEEGEATPEWLLKRVDLALYRAKALGRNRVEAG